MTSQRAPQPGGLDPSPASPRGPFPFVVGCGRSGTTLLRAMLNAHPSMAIPDESFFIEGMLWLQPRMAGGRFEVDRFRTELAREPRFGRWKLPMSDVDGALEEGQPQDLAGAFRCVYAAYAGRHGKPRYGDKTPSLVLVMERVAELFPEASFVHLIRDGRDVTLSYLEAPFGPTTVTGAAAMWRRYVEHGRKVGHELGPGRYLEVHYEDLVADPQRSLRAICDQIDLDFRSDLLSYPDSAEEFLALSSNTESIERVRLPPTTGLRDWRQDLSAAGQRTFAASCGHLLDQLGYEVGPPAGAASRWSDASRTAVASRWQANRDRLRRTSLAAAIRPTAHRLRGC